MIIMLKLLWPSLYYSHYQLLISDIFPIFLSDDEDFNLTADPAAYNMYIMSTHPYRECYRNINISCLDSYGMVVEEMSNASSVIKTRVPLRPYHQYTVVINAMHGSQEMYKKSITVKTGEYAYVPVMVTIVYCICPVYII